MKRYLLMAALWVFDPACENVKRKTIIYSPGPSILLRAICRAIPAIHNRSR